MGRRPEHRPRRKTVTRYEDASGKRCRKGDPGARKVTTRTASYYLFLPPKEPGGRREEVPLGTADEAVAWKRARDVLDARHKEELGILDDRSRQAARPIAEHLEEWLAAVAAGDVSPGRVDMLRSRVSRLVALAKWKRAADIRASSCQAALKALAEPDVVRGRGSAGAGRGASAQTRNHYLAHARQFTAWLFAEGRLSSDPLANVKPLNVAVDRRHDRRCPSDEDVRVLFDHLQGGQPHCLPRVRRGMSGPQRALGYQVQMCGGLRAGELRRLTRASFDLERGEVRITARSDKARKRRSQALPRWLCDRLRDWFAQGGECWGRFPASKPGSLLVADLRRARAGWMAEATGKAREAREKSATCAYEVQTEDGPQYLDMHAWRHWYITQVASTDGISPAVLQSLSRHADPRLTLGTYSHARRDQERAAVDQLPDLGAARPAKKKRK